MWRIIRRTLVVLLLIIALLVAVVPATPQGRVAVRTLLFLPQVLPAIPLKPQQWLTREPTRTEIEFPLAAGMGVADLYVPAGSGRHSAVLFFMGVVPPDRDERRIVALAEGLSRAGMVVMIPWLDTQTENRIIPQDIDSLVRGFQHLLTLERVDPDRVGVGGICTGASMVTVAAQDERISDDVRFINFFAGYYDALDLVRAIGGRSRFLGDDTTPWNPNSLTMRLFTNHLIEGVTDPADRALLGRVIVGKEPILEDELRSLSSEGMAVYRLVQGAPWEEVDGLIGQLSPKTIEFLRIISPSTNIDKLKARVLIMHDTGDRLVPSEESRRLAEALGEDSDTYHTEFSFFQREIQVHVDQSKSIGPIGYTKEALKFFMHMYNIMREVS